MDRTAAEEWIRAQVDPVGAIEVAHERPWATVLSVPLADVRAAADPQSALVFEAYKQVVLEVLEPAADGWIKVRHRDGQQGYVRLAHVWGA